MTLGMADKQGARRRDQVLRRDARRALKLKWCNRLRPDQYSNCHDLQWSARSRGRLLITPAEWSQRGHKRLRIAPDGASYSDAARGRLCLLPGLTRTGRMGLEGVRVPPRAPMLGGPRNRWCDPDRPSVVTGDHGSTRPRHVTLDLPLWSKGSNTPERSP
jgi:hypothetical protein